MPPVPPELEEEEGPDLFGDGERDDIILEDMLSELMSEEMLPAECRDEVLFGDDQAEQGQLETYHRVCGASAAAPSGRGRSSQIVGSAGISGAISGVGHM